MRRNLMVVWWLACLLWSSTFLFIRLGLDELPPITFAWVRLAIALVALAPVALVSRPRTPPSRSTLVHVALAGVLLLGVNYALLFWGAQFIPSGLVAILQAATPLMALLLGWVFGTERVTPRRAAALIGGLAGVATIFGAEALGTTSSALLGAAAVVAGSVCVAFAYVWLKRTGSTLPPQVNTAIQSAAALVPLACLGLVVEGLPRPAEWSGPTWAALLYLALGASVLAFWLNYWLLARMDPSVVLLMGVAEVPIAIALGALVFGERLSLTTLAGGACVLIAVMVRLRDSDGS